MPTNDGWGKRDHIDSRDDFGDEFDWRHSPLHTMSIDDVSPRFVIMASLMTIVFWVALAVIVLALLPAKPVQEDVQVDYRSEIFSAFDNCDARQVADRQDLWDVLECVQDRGVELDFNLDTYDDFLRGGNDG